MVGATLGLLMVMTTGLVPDGAGAQEADGGTTRERHCVVSVVDERDGVLSTGPERCYGTFAEAQDDAAAERVTSSTGGQDGFDTEAASSTIGVHFTGISFTGSSITITGSVCSGGVWYPSGSWNNNIASSYHYCGSSPTRFYDSSTCSGTSYAIYSAASTLGSMNDRASCVRYG
jgi:hypothetical protein